MVSSGSRAIFSIVFLASFVVFSILAPLILSKTFAKVLIKFSNESDGNGYRDISALCSLALPYKRAGCSLLTSS